METEKRSLEEVLAKKSNSISDYERNLRLAEIRDYAFSFVDEVCDEYEDEVVVLSKKNGFQGVEVVGVYLSRSEGYYEIGLDHPIFREFIKFGRREDDPKTAFLDILPKYKSATPQMLYNYWEHPNTTFDGFIKIFSEVKKVVQEGGEEYDPSEEE